MVQCHKLNLGPSQPLLPITHAQISNTGSILGRNGGQTKYLNLPSSFQLPLLCSRTCHGFPRLLECSIMCASSRSNKCIPYAEGSSFQFLGFLSTLFSSLHCAIPTLMSAQAVSSSRLELGSQHPCEVFEDRPFGELGSREEQKVALGSGMGEVGNGRQETSEHVLGVSQVNHFYLTQ